jgi:hypothetical protein
MKKFIAVFSLFILFGYFQPLFADDRFSITVDGAIDALYMRTYLGEYRERLGSQPLPGQVPFLYQGQGITNVFQSSMFLPGIMGRVGFAYNGESMGGSMELRMRTDSEFSAITDWDAWIIPGSWGNFSFRVLGGNTVQSGLIPTHDNFNENMKANILNLGIMVPVWRINSANVRNIETIANFPHGYAEENLGSNLHYTQFYGSQTYDLFMPAGSNTRRTFNFLTDIILSPVTISLATSGLFENVTVPKKDIFEIETAGGARLVGHDQVHAPASTGGLNIAFRIESYPISDLITLAAVYKLNSSFMHKTYNPADLGMLSYAFADIKRASHGYGLYAGLTLSEDFGISFGYSGLHQTWTNPHFQSVVEKDKIRNPTDSENWYSRFSETKFPLYHGIDLRFLFTGVDRLTITQNNNFSFARAKGISTQDAERGIYALGWGYSDFLGNNADRFYSGSIYANDPGNGDGIGRSELYLGLFNAIGLRYAISEQLSTELSITSQFGRFSLNWDGRDASSTTHYLGAYVGASFIAFDLAAGIRGAIRGGLDVRLSSFTFQNAHLTNAMPKHKAGVLEFGIPISVMVLY